MFDDSVVHGFIPEGIQRIEDEGYSNYESLESIHLPEGLIQIGNRAFFGCHNLREITFPSTLVSIGKAAFYYCHSLTHISLPENIKEISDECFLDCNISRIVFPRNLESIGELAFAYNKLKTIVIPKTVKNLSAGSFYKCKHIYVYENLASGLDVAMHNLHPGLAMGALPWSAHRVSVLDKDTSDEKYSFFVSGSLWVPARQEFLSLYDGARVDFAKYDSLINKISGALDRVEVALLRVAYPYEIEEKAKINYIKILHENSKLALEKVIFDRNYKMLKLLDNIGIISCDNIDYLIDYACERSNNAEIRTYLLNYKNENCKKESFNLYI